MAKKSTGIQDWQQKDAARLKALFDEREPKISQMKFGADFEIGTQGMVWQYLTGARALNIDAAVKFARGLGVPINAFSETIADQIAAAFALTNGGRRSNVSRMSGDELADSLASVVNVYLATDVDGRILIDEAVGMAEARIPNVNDLTLRRGI